MRTSTSMAVPVNRLGGSPSFDQFVASLRQNESVPSRSLMASSSTVTRSR